jgi:hypothetical protein
MEDFLFLLVISLAVSVSLFSKKQLAERFVMAERRQTSEAVSPEIRNSLPILKLPEDGTICFESKDYADREKLLSHLKHHFSQRQEKNLPLSGIKLMVAYSRPSGEVKEFEDRITELGIDIFTEWETRK